MISRPSRRSFAAGGLLFALGAGTAGAQTPQADAMSIGSSRAPVQLVEFASMTCPHCALFHRTNWTTLKRDYIDMGRVRLTLHEMLTPPPQAAFAMFQLARCGGADGAEYFRRVGILFERQRTIFDNVATVGDLLNNLVATGAEWGLSRDQIMASLNDPAGSERMMRSINAAEAQGVTQTPTFILNGQRLGEDFQLPDVMARTLDVALVR